ncbi:hypothetical protein [Henriciella marina]|uniref:AbiTii domain-containing protein n=1 Tax=Henriciella marina TaxID=453851 RepID=A0ABT4LWK3_9PROT|nr:hypothetical protein [Henriciella marina]MCZ4298752.1 hypothetical protein [Henriciella marina]
MYDQSSSGLAELAQQIRERLNSYLSIGWHMPDNHDFNRFCGALDNIQDGIDAAFEYEKVHDAAGPSTLLVYGFLQALYVVQDSVETLCKAVGLKWEAKNCVELRPIRDARNRLSGHPSSTGRGNENNPLSWASGGHHDIHRDRFSMNLYWYDQKSEKITVEVNEFRQRNAEVLVPICQQVISIIDQREEAARMALREKSLGELIPKNLGYLFQKIPSEGDRRGQALSHINILRNALDPMREYCAAANAGSDGIDWLINRCNAALDALTLFHSDETPGYHSLEFADVISKGLEHYFSEVVHAVKDAHSFINSRPPQAEPVRY